MDNYVKFSSHLNEMNYFTQIDLEREHIRIQENGITVFDDKLHRFKKNVHEGGWLANVVYESILDNAEKLTELLSKG